MTSDFLNDVTCLMSKSTFFLLKPTQLDSHLMMSHFYVLKLQTIGDLVKTLSLRA